MNGTLQAGITRRYGACDRLDRAVTQDQKMWASIHIAGHV